LARKWKGQSVPRQGACRGRAKGRAPAFLFQRRSATPFAQRHPKFGVGLPHQLRHSRSYGCDCDPQPVGAYGPAVPAWDRVAALAAALAAARGVSLSRPLSHITFSVVFKFKTMAQSLNHLSQRKIQRRCVPNLTLSVTLSQFPRQKKKNRFFSNKKSDFMRDLSPPPHFLNYIND